MKVSDHLTWLAEAITEEVVNQAWAQMSERYGVPPEVAVSGQRGFAVVAYGKLGGIELGYGSDLDLVFLHGGDPNSYTDGRKPIDSRQFYLRLAQRILHLFSTRTPPASFTRSICGCASGDSGLLVSSLSAYELYQQNEAWTWEHQALVRARPIYGDEAVIAEFARIRRAVLAKERDLPTLAREVREMRHKMRDHLLKAGAGEFDLKQSPAAWWTSNSSPSTWCWPMPAANPRRSPAGPITCASSMSACWRGTHAGAGGGAQARLSGDPQPRPSPQPLRGLPQGGRRQVAAGARPCAGGLATAAGE